MVTAASGCSSCLQHDSQRTLDTLRVSKETEFQPLTMFLWVEQCINSLYAGQQIIQEKNLDSTVSTLITFISQLHKDAYGTLWVHSFTVLMTLQPRKMSLS